MCVCVWVLEKEIHMRSAFIFTTTFTTDIMSYQMIHEYFTNLCLCAAIQCRFGCFSCFPCCCFFFSLFSLVLGSWKSRCPFLLYSILVSWADLVAAVRKIDRKLSVLKILNIIYILLALALPFISLSISRSHFSSSFMLAPCIFIKIIETSFFFSCPCRSGRANAIFFSSSSLHRWFDVAEVMH